MAQSQAEPYQADPPPYGGDLQYTADLSPKHSPPTIDAHELHSIHFFF